MVQRQAMKEAKGKGLAITRQPLTVDEMGSSMQSP